jgi:flagellar protein FlaI
MAEIGLPFPRSRIIQAARGSGANPLSRFPEALRRAAEGKPYLQAYLQGLPIEEIGVPQYYPELSRSLQSLPVRNLIYPIKQGLFVHIYPDLSGERDYYIPITPELPVDLDGLLEEVDLRLLDWAEEIGKAEEGERAQVFLRCLERVCTTRPGEDDGAIHVSPAQLEAIRYLTLRDKVGLGVLQPLILDPYIEDISCSGMGSIFVEHKVFQSTKTSIVFSSLDELDEFVVWLGERIKRPVTLRTPIVDAVLPDGSRINIVYGRDIAKRGSNFTIRKFAEEPLSIVQLIAFGTLTYTMAAYLWMVIEEGLNVFVCGETASGKTTLLNALTTFILPDAKVVSIEDTPELQVPQANWLREVVRDTGGNEKSSSVDMFALLKAALRQRPDRIMIGEIRGIEGNIAFQAMQTGHGVMATFHAASVQKLIQRLTGNPINVPKTYIDNLDVVVIQSAVRGPDGRTVRRVLSINEIVDYEASTDSFSFITTFRWRPDDDTFEFPGNKNSYVLEEKLAKKRNLPENRKREIYQELLKRARVLEKLHKKGGIDGFYQLFKVITEARKQGLV